MFKVDSCGFHPCLICHPNGSDMRYDRVAQREGFLVSAPKVVDPVVFQIQDISKLVARVAKIANEDNYRTALRSFKAFYPTSMLGSGIVAEVHDITGSGYVVKIAGRIDGSYHWLRKSAMDASDNPFMPRVLTAQPFADGGYIVVMEKLDSIQAMFGERQRGFENQADDLEQLACFGVDFFDTDRLQDTRHKNRSMIRNVIANPKICNDITSIKKLCEQVCGGIDMHYANFMVRGDQIVITDPIC
jgi:hypothetical protein